MRTFEFNIRQLKPGSPPPGVDMGFLGYLWGPQAASLEDAYEKLTHNPNFDAERHEVASCRVFPLGRI